MTTYRPPPLLALLGEFRSPYEAQTLLMNPVWRRADSSIGRDLPVLVLPGFLGGDWALPMLMTWLRRSGCQPFASGIRMNVDCANEAVRRLEKTVERLAQESGRPIAVIGHSRGGLFARLLGTRRPDDIEGIITLAAPSLAPFVAHRLTVFGGTLIEGLNRLGVPGSLSADCLHGSCARDITRELCEPWPEEVDYLSVYSRTDGVINWRACLDPGAEYAEVRSSHGGMIANPAVYRILAARLRQLATPTVDSTHTA